MDALVALVVSVPLYAFLIRSMEEAAKRNCRILPRLMEHQVSHRSSHTLIGTQSLSIESSLATCQYAQWRNLLLSVNILSIRQRPIARAVVTQTVSWLQPLSTQVYV